MGLVPPVDRLPLQRATDEALQRLQAQEQAAMHFEIDAALRELGDQNAARTTWDTLGITRELV